MGETRRAGRRVWGLDWTWDGDGDMATGRDQPSAGFVYFHLARWQKERPNDPQLTVYMIYGMLESDEALKHTISKISQFTTHYF